MTYAVDVGRLVIQCACERAIAWHGTEHALAQGWRGRWKTDEKTGRLRRLWVCPECEARRPRGRQPAQTSTFRMPLPDIGTAMTQPARALALLDEHILTDPEAVAWFFVELFRKRGLIQPHVARLWEAWARARGFDPPPPGKRRRRRKPQQNEDVT